MCASLTYHNLEYSSTWTRRARSQFAGAKTGSRGYRAKLWRMPESALKGLLNALTNIGTWRQRLGGGLLAPDRFIQIDKDVARALGHGELAVNRLGQVCDVNP